MQNQIPTWLSLIIKCLRKYCHGCFSDWSLEVHLSLTDSHIHYHLSAANHSLSSVRHLCPYVFGSVSLRASPPLFVSLNFWAHCLHTTLPDSHYTGIKEHEVSEALWVFQRERERNSLPFQSVKNTVWRGAWNLKREVSRSRSHFNGAPHIHAIWSKGQPVYSLYFSGCER